MSAGRGAGGVVVRLSAMHARAPSISVLTSDVIFEIFKLTQGQGVLPVGDGLQIVAPQAFKAVGEP